MRVRDGVCLALGMISHVKFVAIPTADQDRALKFWTEAVGCRVLTDQPTGDARRWIELRIGSSDTRVVLSPYGTPGGPFAGAFACDNVEQTYKELSARGVQFITAPTKQHWGTYAIFQDPDGNQIMVGTR